MILILLVCGWPGFFSKHIVAVVVQRSGMMFVYKGILARVVMIVKGSLGMGRMDMVR